MLIKKKDNKIGFFWDGGGEDPADPHPQSAGFAHELNALISPS